MAGSLLVPQVALLRVVAAGGPYACGDVVSLAFNDAMVGRLIPHGATQFRDATAACEAIVPETIDVEVALAAEPYERGERLTLSFVDPRFVRVFRGGSGAPPAAEMPTAAAPPLAHGVRLALGWEADRPQRFVRLVDTLFTIERLGCYRHVLALRLLVADTIATGAPAVDAAANEHLGTLRAALAQALGRPLLDACIPGFTVTPGWLDEREERRAAQALAALRSAVLPYADDGEAQAGEALAQRTVGRLSRETLAAMASGALDASLPALVPCLATVPAVTAALTAYRGEAVRAFGRFAGVPGDATFAAMTRPEPALDDRLWSLAGAIAESFGGIAAA